MANDALQSIGTPEALTTVQEWRKREINEPAPLGGEKFTQRAQTGGLKDAQYFSQS
jgi:hypothetical protein